MDNTAIVTAQRLTQLREDSGLTQDELAEVLGVKQSTISYYESGRHEPSIGIVKKYAEYFQVSSDHIIGINSKKGEYVYLADIAEKDRDTIKHMAAYFRRLNNKRG